MTKRIYLAGPISGMTFDQSEEWRETFARKLHSTTIDCYSPLRQKHVLREVGVIEDSYKMTPLSTDRGIMTRDFDDCTKSDLVVFNLLECGTRVSIGTMMELAWCFQARIPTIVIMPEKGNVHDHPMVREAISFRVDTLDQAVEVAKAFLLPSWEHGSAALKDRLDAEDHRKWVLSKSA